MKFVLIIVTLILLITGGSVYFLMSNNEETSIKEEPVIVEQPVPIEDKPTLPIIENEVEETTTEQKVVPQKDTTVIGKSVSENNIKAYHFGTGETELIFISGIHGGYSWNTSALAFEIIDWLKTNPNVIPKNLKVTIIPVLNPDGLKKVTPNIEKFKTSEIKASEAERVAGRFNTNNIDLNRNFDCEWQPKGVWQNREVSGGKSAFSEPESQALRNYVTNNKPKAVIAYYGAAGGVYSSNCKNGILPETKTMTDLYAKASGYPAYQEFDYYQITGDMVNWLAKQNIPAISVLLTDYKQTEFSKNKAGIEAILKNYAE